MASKNTGTGRLPPLPARPGAAAPPLAALPAEPSGAELAAEIDAYCARIGISSYKFSILAGMSSAGSANVRLAARPKAQTVAKARSLIALYPDGNPDWFSLGAWRRRSGGGGPHHGTERARLDAALANGMAPARPAVSADAVREAEDAARRRAAARSIHYGDQLAAPVKLPPAAAVQARLIDEPGGAIAAVRRKWPELWQRIVVAAKAVDAMPGQILAEAVEQGLDAMGAA